MAVAIGRSTTNFGGRYIPRPPLPKPRLSLKHQVWSCVSVDTSRGLLGFYAGYGYTQREAYEDWRRRITMGKPRD